MENTDAVWPSGPPTVGQRAERSRRVEPGDIRRFTEISGDENPLHFDPDFAARTPFGEIVVQGGVTTAILLELQGAGSPRGCHHRGCGGPGGPTRQAHHPATDEGHQG